MLQIVSIFNFWLSAMTILGQVIILFIILSLAFGKKEGNTFLNFIGGNAILFSFFIALASIIGSLIYSEIANFTPCVLCWYQRIFLYSQVVILAVALWKKDDGVVKYSLALSIVGGAIALYQYLMQFGFAPALPCSAAGSSGSCSQIFVVEFGYVTIPMMSLTAFLLIIAFMATLKIHKRNEQ